MRRKNEKMKKVVLIGALFLAIMPIIYGQSTAFVFQGGPNMGFQRWDNSFERQPLFKWHASLGIESINNEDDAFSIFGQFGYHVVGSATRFRFFYQGGGGVATFTEEFRFNNLTAIAGAKFRKPLGETTRLFYFGGLRGDYTLSTNLDELSSRTPELALYYPINGFTNKWILGISMGGGLEWNFAEVVGMQIGLSFHPDLTLQYNQPPIFNVINPLNPSQTTNIPERRIRNATFELSVGLRLLRKVEYVD